VGEETMQARYDAETIPQQFIALDSGATEPEPLREPSINLTLTQPSREVEGQSLPNGQSQQTMTGADLPVDHRFGEAQWLAGMTQSTRAIFAKDRRRGGKVQLTTQDQLALSALRRLFKKNYNEIIDLQQFAANDLYARMLLNRASKSDDTLLAAVAMVFLDGMGRPRLHRRAGWVDVDMSIENAPQTP
jgi:hypothetical protein